MGRNLGVTAEEIVVERGRDVLASLTRLGDTDEDTFKGENLFGSGFYRVAVPLVLRVEGVHLSLHLFLVWCRSL